MSFYTNLWCQHRAMLGSPTSSGPDDDHSLPSTGKGSTIGRISVDQEYEFQLCSVSFWGLSAVGSSLEMIKVSYRGLIKVTL